MNEVENKGTIKGAVEAMVATIPAGKVMTYGQLAALAGSPRAARVVGGIAHFGDPQLPWHRVVNRKGEMAKGFPGGRMAHRALLEEEGCSFQDDITLEGVDRLLWWPEQ